MLALQWMRLFGRAVGGTSSCRRPGARGSRTPSALVSSRQRKPACSPPVHRSSRSLDRADVSTQSERACASDGREYAWTGGRRRGARDELADPPRHARALPTATSIRALPRAGVKTTVLRLNSSGPPIGLCARTARVGWRTGTTRRREARHTRPDDARDPHSRPALPPSFPLFLPASLPQQPSIRAGRISTRRPSERTSSASPCLDI